MHLEVSTAIRALVFACGALALSTSAHATTIGPQTELVSQAGVDQRAPAVSFNGTTYVIVWEDSRNIGTNGIDLYLARIDTDGDVLASDATGIAVLSNNLAEAQRAPAITYNSSVAAHLLAWEDPRNTFKDIYVSRFLPSSGSIIEAAGVQVTSGTATEIAPQIAFAQDSYLIVYQSNPAGGGSVVQARRMHPWMSFVDPAPFEITNGTTEGRPKVLPYGNNFIVAWERTGSDLYMRTIPDLGAVPVDNGTPLSTTSTLAKTHVSLAPVGIGNIIGVWQDARGADDDIWGMRLTPSLVPLGEMPVSQAVNNELQPKVAGDENGAMVVWLDRRNSTSVAITYAARLDASGNVSDPEGFPILAYNQTSFEHTIVKGPGSDYLVASVRTGNPYRIFYRIVRDEMPDGTLAPSGPSLSPADGVTPAVLVFDDAQGASGFDVVNGTLYTVTISDPSVVIGAPDADPILPGYQLEAIDGQVTVSMTTIEHEIVTVDLVSVEGASSGQSTLEFINVPPEVSGVAVTPLDPRSMEDLNLAYTYFDVNLDPENGTVIEWSRNSAVQGTWANQLTVPSSATVRGDQWRARVTPRDGIEFGSFIFSNTVIVGNTPPSVLDARIDPAVDVRTRTPIRARYIFDDQDGDAEGQDTVLTWYDRGVEQTDIAGVVNLPDTRIEKGQVWHFTITPHDGIEFGDMATSATVAVINTRPISNAGANSTVIERREHTLDGSGSSDIDPQDVLQFQWTQVGGATVTLSNPNVEQPTFTAPSVDGTTFLHFNLEVSDGEEQSIFDQDSRVVVEIEPVPDDDGDRLDNEEEAIHGTDPAQGDTDRDSLSDREEVDHGTNPLDEDSDDDGIRDGQEGRPCKNCQSEPFGDPDNDNVINALDPDSDDDALFDGTEISISSPLQGGGTAPYTYSGTDEAAGFFIPDADSRTFTDPTVDDTDSDTHLDGTEDANHNGRVDDGESDPNDPNDPAIPCTPGGNECQNGTVCINGICRPESEVDGGLSCQPMTAGLECCSGGCTGGTLVDPVCPSNGATLRCPVGTDQCVEGACSGPNNNGGEDSSCSCNATLRDETTPWFAILLLLPLLRRR